jgi:hypothetical protein
MLFRWIELAQRRSPRFRLVGSGCSDPRSLGGLLGGLSLAVASCLVAATVWPLPRQVDRDSAWRGISVVLVPVTVVAAVAGDSWSINGPS